MQGGRKRTEVAKIGKEPVSQRENAIEDCLNELLEMAKTIGKEQLLLGKDSEVARNTIRNTYLSASCMDNSYFNQLNRLQSFTLVNDLCNGLVL